MGETVEVCREVMPDSEESLTVSDAINQLNEWRNGRPMTVRAVKHKNLLKKQIKQEIFEDLHCQQTPVRNWKCFISVVKVRRWSSLFC